MTTPFQARKYASGLVSASISASMLRSLSDQIEALTKERDALAAAAKLALFQMERNQYLVRSGAPRISAEKFHDAITALRQAGVQ